MGGVRQEINRMGPGPDNSVWVYSRSLGLVRFHKGVFRRAPAYPEPCNVAQIQEDREGTLVVCSERVLRIVGERVDQLTKTAPTDTIKSATRDGNGRLWIGLTEGGVVRLGEGGELIRSYGSAEGLPAGAVNYLLAPGTDRLWVGTEHGLALIEQGRVRRFTTPRRAPFRRDPKAYARSGRYAVGGNGKGRCVGTRGTL